MSARTFNQQGFPGQLKRKSYLSEWAPCGPPSSAAVVATLGLPVYSSSEYLVS